MKLSIYTFQVLEDGHRHCDLMAKYGVKCACKKWLFRLPDAVILTGDRSLAWYETRVCTWCDLAIESTPATLLLVYPYSAAMIQYRRRKAK